MFHYSRPDEKTKVRINHPESPPTFVPAACSLLLGILGFRFCFSHSARYCRRLLLNRLVPVNLLLLSHAGLKTQINRVNCLSK